MPYCPECGDEMLYDPKLRRFACKGCGLYLTSQELMEMRDKLRPDVESKEEAQKKKRSEYLKWWLSKKD